MKSDNQQLYLPFLNEYGVELQIKREDQLHPHISGNKFRKLGYNLEAAKKGGFSSLLTFGGAFSNHILATACAGKEYGFHTIGLIRGEELETHWRKNPTLRLAAEFGMQLDFVDRTTYREKSSPDFVEALRKRYGDFYLLPEGGTNALAVKGCEEILSEADAHFDYVCCSVGTGGTLAGLINSSKARQTVLGYAALKGDFLPREVSNFTTKTNWKLIFEYHFGGYAKVDTTLVQFINTFYGETGIPLDPIYTGKLLFGIFAQIKSGFFQRGSRILAIHTGGLQGIKGMNRVLKMKNLPLLTV